MNCLWCGYSMGPLFHICPISAHVQWDIEKPRQRWSAHKKALTNWASFIVKKASPKHRFKIITYGGADIRTHRRLRRIDALVVAR